MTRKIVWRVQPPPTGRYRSFQRRGWPQATFGKDGPLLAMLDCEDDYTPARAQCEELANQITIRVCHHQHPDMPRSWKVFALKQPARSFAQAQARVAAFYESKPDWLPKE